MTRKTNRVNGKEYHYYYCPTGKKHGCTNPVMLKESKLIDCVQESLKAYIQNVASLETLLNSIDQSSINQALAKEYTDHISENERRLEHTQNCKSRLYESLVEGMITKEEYASYKVKYTRQAEEIKAAITALKEKLKDVLENKSERNRWISHFILPDVCVTDFLPQLFGAVLFQNLDGFRRQADCTGLTGLGWTDINALVLGVQQCLPDHHNAFVQINAVPLKAHQFSPAATGIDGCRSLPST